jgi:thiamine-phosphate pyrophosphorylase
MRSAPILCYVTERRALLGPETHEKTGELAGAIRNAIAAQVDWVQIREKDLAARALLELVRPAVGAALGSPTQIVVNDRLDVALAARAAGVHLGEQSLPVASVKQWCRAGHAPQGFMVGASCHSLAGALEAERNGADYVVFGPVFATPSKLDYGPPQGLTKLEEVCRALRIPVLAIGGITLENARECLRAGAAGIAAIRLFQQATDLPGLVTKLRAAL